MPLPQRLQPETIAEQLSALQHSCPAMRGSHASPASSTPLPHRLQLTARAIVTGIWLPAVLLWAVTVTAKSDGLGVPIVSGAMNVHRLSGPGAGREEKATQPCRSTRGGEASSSDGAKSAPVAR